MKTKDGILIFSFLTLFATTSLAQWERLKQPSFPEVGYLNAIDGILYAGTNAGGLYSSPDGGTTWTRFDNIKEDNITAVQKSEGYLWVSLYNDYIQYSDNNGVSWNQIENYDLYSPGFIDVHGADTLYVANSSGLYITYDRGKTIAKKITSSNGLPDDWVFKTLKRHDTLWALTNGGASYSLNEGTSWTTVVGPGGVATEAANTIAFNGGKIYLVTNTGLYVSSDKAKTWVNRSTDLSDNQYYDIEFSGTTLYLGSTGGVYKCTSEGGPWKNVFSSTDATNYGIFGSDLLMFNSTLYVATGPQGIYKTTNGGTSWLPTYDGIYAVDIRSMEYVSNTLFVGDKNSFFYTSTNDGTTINIATTLGGTVTFTKYNPFTKKLFVKDRYGVSIYDPGTMTLLSSAYANGSESVEVEDIAFYGDTVVALNGQTLYMYTGASGIFQKWVDLPGGSDFSKVFIYKDTLLVAQQQTSNMYLSNIKNISFSSVSLPIRYGGTWTVTEMKSSGNKIYASNYVGLFSSETGGRSWKEEIGPFSGSDCEGVEVWGTHVFVPGYQVIYHSPDGGNTWENFSDGLHTSRINCLKYGNGYLFAGSAGAGVWRYKLNGVVTALQEPMYLEGRVADVYPNPSKEAIYLKNVPANEDFEILTLEGVRILEGKWQQLPISVVDLPKGVFVVRTNSSVLRFVKE